MVEKASSAATTDYPQNGRGLLGGPVLCMRVSNRRARPRILRTLACAAAAHNSPRIETQS